MNSEYILNSQEFTTPLQDALIENPFYSDEADRKSLGRRMFETSFGLTLLWIFSISAYHYSPSDWKVYMSSLIFFAFCASLTILISYYLLSRDNGLIDSADSHVYHERIRIEESDETPTLNVSFSLKPEWDPKQNFVLTLPIHGIRKLLLNPYHNCLIIDGDFRIEYAQRFRPFPSVVHKLIIPLNFRDSKIFLERLESLSILHIQLDDRIHKKWISDPRAFQ